MLNYNLEPQQYMELDLVSMDKRDINELAYFLWCVFRHDALLMEWRRSVLLPMTAPLPIFSSAEDGYDE
jgi:hypothetical protein